MRNAQFRHCYSEVARETFRSARGIHRSSLCSQPRHAIVAYRDNRVDAAQMIRDCTSLKVI